MTDGPLSQMKFAWPWRPYQVRVLNEMEAHLGDRRLHVVAAPGSGKTILGLEAFRRLGRPAVILSPTITIRDQWIQRLAHFLPEGAAVPPPWASRDLGKPGFLTSITYQALHARHRRTARAAANEPGEMEADADSIPFADSEAVSDRPPGAKELGGVIRAFRRIGVGTLILDEAHHLRKEWWTALSRLAGAIDDLTIVSLTATPPFEVTGQEWRRYEELCGPIDEEIPVPELVKSGTLCPHQDYIWAVTPLERDAHRVRDYDGTVDRLTDELLHDENLLTAIESHPWLTLVAPPDAMLDTPEVVVSFLVYLKALGRPLPPVILEWVVAWEEEIPAPSKRWWQILTQHYLWGDTWKPDGRRDAQRDALAKRLRSDGLLRRRELSLETSRSVRSVLSLTATKIDACVEINALERKLRGAELRQVVLTDFIRDEDIARPAPALERQLGAWPVFRALAIAAPPGRRPGLAMLTGRQVVVHVDRVDDLIAELGDIDAALAPVGVEQLGNAFVRYEPSDSGRFVRAMTHLLAQGRLNVLVGTRALLGEGWDAPVINSLVLASYVGSFVLTNQMRGRAIRRDPDQPEKTASIWHLVAAVPDATSGWEDMELLRRRFDTFVGVSATRPALESGLRRMDLPTPRGSGAVDAINRHTLRQFGAHDAVAERWRNVIDLAVEGRVAPSVRATKPPSFRSLRFNHTLRYLLVSVGASVASVYGAFFHVVDAGSFAPQWVWRGFALASAIAFLWAGPKFVRAAYLYWKHFPVDGSLRQIALAVHEALVKAGMIRAAHGATSVRVDPLDSGGFSVALVDGSFYESSLFADTLAEILGPVGNARYLLTRSGSGSFGRRKDYHAVPRILGAKMDLARLMHLAWNRHVGESALVYTRRPKGRVMLFEARARAFSSAFEDSTRRYDRWR